jgi:hypothetical protein
MNRLFRAFAVALLMLSAYGLASAQARIEFGVGFMHYDAEHAITHPDTTVAEHFMVWSVLLGQSLRIASIGHDVSIGTEWDFIFGLADSTRSVEGRILLGASYGANSTDKTSMLFGATFAIGESITGITRFGSTKDFFTTFAMAEADWTVDPTSWHILKLRLTKSLIAGATRDEDLGVLSRFPSYGLTLIYQVTF